MEPRRRMQLYRTMHLWHWISAAVCFAALALFTVTGITLNHADVISAKPAVRSGIAQLTPDLLAELRHSSPGDQDPPPPELIDPIVKRLLLPGALLVGLMAAPQGAANWEQLSLFLNSVSFNLQDPQFGRDVGFYVFILPWLQTLYHWAIFAVGVTARGVDLLLVFDDAAAGFFDARLELAVDAPVSAIEFGGLDDDAFMDVAVS